MLSRGFNEYLQLSLSVHGVNRCYTASTHDDVITTRRVNQTIGGDGTRDGPISELSLFLGKVVNTSSKYPLTHVKTCLTYLRQLMPE